MPNNLFPMDFGQANIDFMINLGYADALAAIQKGEGVSFDEMFEAANKYEQELLFGAQTR